MTCSTSRRSTTPSSPGSRGSSSWTRISCSSPPSGRAQCCRKCCKNVLKKGCLKYIIFSKPILSLVTRELWREFLSFSPGQCIGLAPDLSPHYWHRLDTYRKRKPDTELGRPGPSTQGFNSGVALYDLECLRSSREYSDQLRPEQVRDGDDELSDSILLLSGVRPRHKIQHEDHSRGPGLVH